MEGWVEGRVLENYHWNERLCTLRVQASVPEFEAGQFLRLGLMVDDELLARPYSLVNAPGTDIAEFYFNKVEGGPLSTRLHQLQPGDQLWLSKTVAGFMTLSELPRGKNLWLLATGTAIGPFLSILAAGEVWDHFEKIVLVHGIRTAEERTYTGVIARYQKAHPEQFTSLASITRENVAGTLHQRITDAIANGSLEQAAGINFDVEHDRFMLCGNPGMIKDCVRVLADKGFKRHRRREPGQIVMEVYK